MQETITLARHFQGELPFTLNLPGETYPVHLNGNPYPIELLQEWLAIANGPGTMMAGSQESLRELFGDRWGTLPMRELRTIVRHRDEVQLQHADLLVPTETQLVEAATVHLIRKDAESAPGNPEALQRQGEQWLDGLGPEDRSRFIADTSIRLTADKAFGRDDIDLFCDAVNVLIRLYMATFRDMFAHEISECVFSGTAFHGISSLVFCNGQQFDRTRQGIRI